MLTNCPAHRIAAAHVVLPWPFSGAMTNVAIHQPSRNANSWAVNVLPEPVAPMMTAFELQVRCRVEIISMDTNELLR